MRADSFRWGRRFNLLGVVVGDGSMIVTRTTPNMPDPVGTVVNRPAGGVPMQVSARHATLA